MRALLFCTLLGGFEVAGVDVFDRIALAIEDDETARKLTKIIDALEALDDVTNVATNAA